MVKIASVVMGLGVPAAAAAFFGNEVLDRKAPFADSTYHEKTVLTNCEQVFFVNDIPYKIGEILETQAPIITIAENDRYMTIELNGKHITFLKECKAAPNQQIAENEASIHFVSLNR